VSNIKLKNLIVAENFSIRHALKVINMSRLGVCFVTKKKKLLKVVTDGDIRRSLLKGYKLSDNITKIKSKKNFITVRENYDFLDLQKKISKYKIIPIINKRGEIIDYANEKRFRQLPQAEPSFKGNELKYVSEAIKSGWISSVGKYVNIFQKKFSFFVKNKYCLATSSGTTAIQLALATLKLKPQDEIIVPDYTFVSPINSVILCKAKPVLVDVDYNNCCLDVKKVKKLINKKTRVIIAVHLYGHPADIISLKKLCKKYNIVIIEDCAEALGTYIGKKHVGSFGEFGTFSFFANKTITTGEGGMVVFNKKEHYNLAKSLRDHGMSKNTRYWHDFVGFNYRITNIQAAIGLAQLEKFDEILKKKIKIFEHYKKQLMINYFFDLAREKKGTTNCHWLVYLKLKNFAKSEYKKIRIKLIKFLKKNGVECRTGFFAANLMPIYKKYVSKKITYENSRLLSHTLLTLPSSTTLDINEIKLISNLINSFFQKNYTLKKKLNYT